MKWLQRFLGLHDKDQKARTQEVAEYVHDKKNEFAVTMAKAQQKAQQQHDKARKLIPESAKIESRILDITQQIYMVTGHR